MTEHDKSFKNHKYYKMMKESSPVKCTKLEEIYLYLTERDRIRILEELDSSPVVVWESGVIIDYDGSLYQELDSIPIIAKLGGRKQLGLEGNCTDFVSRSHAAAHTRYTHSLVMATKLDYIAQTHGLDRILVTSSGIFHDVATPPFSDSVSKPLGLNDQEYFGYVLNRCSAALRFLERRGISKRRLCSIVDGTDTSPIGQLVSSRGSIDVDRWSYVIEDAINLGQATESLGSTYYPDPFKAFDIIKGQVVFLDVGEVKRFLEARVCMIEQVYLKDKLKAKEAFFGHLLKRMRRKGIIRNDEMFSMSEDELQRRCLHFDKELAERIFHLDGFDIYGRFYADPKELTSFLLKETKRPFVVEQGHPPNPAVDTPVLHNGRVELYRELEPFHAAILRRRLDCFNSTDVFGYGKDSELKSVVARAERKFRIYQPSIQPLLEYATMLEREMTK